MKTLALTLALAATAAGSALAAGGPHDGAIAARKGIMQYYALNLGVLGGMAKGEVAYDEAMAQQAADNLAAAAALDASMLWPQGSDNATAAGATRALPAIWAEGSDIGAKSQAFKDAAAAMKDAAGMGAEALGEAMKGLGASCGGCHKSFRAE